jgi:adenylate kinase family enzyme
VLSRVGITGASGCGATTLGAALAAEIGAVHIDTDDHYWVATDPPYREKRGVPERLARIAAGQALTGRWILSGTLDRWAEPAIADAELIVFLEVPTDVRLERLRLRERARFGQSLLPGGAMHETHSEFIEWAAQYEDGTLPGRSRPRHERWLAGLGMPVLRLDGSRPTGDLVAAILRGDQPAIEARPASASSLHRPAGRSPPPR